MGLLKDGYAVMSLGTRQLTEEKPFKKEKEILCPLRHNVN